MAALYDDVWEPEVPPVAAGPGDPLRGSCTPPKCALPMVPVAALNASPPPPLLFAGVGVQGLLALEEKDRTEPGLRMGEEGKTVPVGCVSSLCRCMRSRTMPSSLKGDGFAPS